MTKLNRILQIQTGGGVTGGIAGYIANLVCTNALKDFSFVVTSALGEAKALRQKRKYGDAHVVEMPPTYGMRSLPAILQLVLRLVRSNDIALVHSHALRAGFVCAFLNRFFKIRFVHTNHGLRFQQKRGALRQFFFRELELFVLRGAELVFCVRQSDAALLRRIAPAHAGKIKTIVTRVDMTSGTTGYQKMQSGGSRPVIVGVGSIIPVKRVDRFIDWLAALSAAGVEFEAVWLGDGPLGAEMERRAAAADVRVAWRGHVDAETVAIELGRADLMLLTSEFEVLSLAALEAMAKGVPIITTEFFGVSDFVKDQENGIVFAEGMSASEKAIRIANLLASATCLNNMRRQAQAFFVARFSDTEKMGAEYASYYRDLFGFCE